MPNLRINLVCISIEVNLTQTYGISHKMGHLKPRSIHIECLLYVKDKILWKFLRGIDLTHHVLQVWIQFTQWMFIWSPVSKKVITTVIRFLLLLHFLVQFLFLIYGFIFVKLLEQCHLHFNQYMFHPSIYLY